MQSSFGNIHLKDIVTIDILGGNPVFKGTRVPIESLFMHLAQGISIPEFLSDFDSVSKEQVSAILALTGGLFASTYMKDLYEC